MSGGTLLFSMLAQAGFPEDIPKPEPLLPPVELPWPVWVYWASGAVVLLVLLGIWALWRVLANRPKGRPVDPRKDAVAHLLVMNRQLESLEPYPFSIAVSDILRRYVSLAYRVAAEQRTSPEFLDEVARSPHFTAWEQELLNEFLQRVDLIKFARHEASTQESALLLEQALVFVRGEKTAEGSNA